jgi:hypothetical protein
MNHGGFPDTEARPPNGNNGRTAAAMMRLNERPEPRFRRSEAVGL